MKTLVTGSHSIGIVNKGKKKMFDWRKLEAVFALRIFAGIYVCTCSHVLASLSFHWNMPGIPSCTLYHKWTDKILNFVWFHFCIIFDSCLLLSMYTTIHDWSERASERAHFNISYTCTLCKISSSSFLSMIRFGKTWKLNYSLLLNIAVVFKC